MRQEYRIFRNGGEYARYFGYYCTFLSAIMKKIDFVRFSLLQSSFYQYKCIHHCHFESGPQSFDLFPVERITVDLESPFEFLSYVFHVFLIEHLPITIIYIEFNDTLVFW